MQKGLAVLLLLVFTLSSPAQVGRLPTWDNRARSAWWAQNPTPDLWPQAAADLTALLEADYKQNGSSSFSNSDFQGWLEHLEWIRLGLDNPDVLTDPENLKTFIALGQDDAISHLFVEKMEPRDIKKEALKNIIQLGRANLSDLHDYAALGVAYSLVFDQPFPRDWPHHQVPQSAVPTGDLDIVTRFNFYVQSNKDHKLEQDLTQLTFENLKFLVDSQVKLSEFEYAQKSHLAYSHFDQAFFAITYDTSRTNNGDFAFTWGLPTYGLADIEKNGGICVDQAYYATEMGKGRGIPTLYFHGQGAGGGHAWFGYMTRSGRWDLDCGRYESQNYPKGYAVDPQTWEPINDAKLTNFFKNGDKNENYLPARTAIAWARLDANDNATARKILDEARAIMPELAQTWELEAAFLQKTGASDDDLKVFYQNWITQFQTVPDLKVEGQRLLLAVLKKTNDPGAQDLERSIVMQNRSSGFDQGIDGAAGPIFAKIDSGDWDGARLEYEKTIRDFGEQGGGTLFYMIVEPYITACLKGNQINQADRGIRFTEDRMPLEPGSIIGTQFGELKGKVHDQKSAAGP